MEDYIVTSPMGLGSLILTSDLETGEVRSIRFDTESKDQYLFYFILNGKLESRCPASQIDEIEGISIVPNYDVIIRHNKDLSTLNSDLHNCNLFRIDCIDELNQRFNLSLNY